MRPNIYFETISDYFCEFANWGLFNETGKKYEDGWILINPLDGCGTVIEITAR